MSNFNVDHLFEKGATVIQAGTVLLNGLKSLTVPLPYPVPTSKLHVTPNAECKVGFTVVNGEATEIIFTWINTNDVSMFYTAIDLRG